MNNNQKLQVIKKNAKNQMLLFNNNMQTKKK